MKFDFCNMLDMYYATLKSILIALQDGNTNKAIDKCTEGMRIIKKLKTLHKIKSRISP